ncbi:MAG: TIM barrel protein [Treponema sp.]|nr:TIM barrel protein [Treponema sp.]
MKVSVCIDAVMPGRDITQTLRGLRSIGVSAFEFWSWWNRDLDTLKNAIDETGLVPVAMCTKFISLTSPVMRMLYIRGLEDSIAAAEKLGCRMLISQVGNDTGADKDSQRESIVAGLRACLPLLEQAGITLVIEPLNIIIDHKGYFLWKSSEGFEIIREVHSPHVRLLYDIYHQQVTEGNIVNTITANVDLIGHIHAAGLPGRGPLDTGELDYRFIFDAVRKAGYSGYVGFEYFCSDADPLAGIQKCMQM